MFKPLPDPCFHIQFLGYASIAVSLLEQISTGKLPAKLLYLFWARPKTGFIFTYVFYNHSMAITFIYFILFFWFNIKMQRCLQPWLCIGGPMLHRCVTQAPRRLWSWAWQLLESGWCFMFYWQWFIFSVGCGLVFNQSFCTTLKFLPGVYKIRVVQRSPLWTLRIVSIVYGVFPLLCLVSELATRLFIFLTTACR